MATLRIGHTSFMGATLKNEYPPWQAADMILQLEAGRRDAVEGYGVILSLVIPMDKRNKRNRGREKTTSYRNVQDRLHELAF